VTAKVVPAMQPRVLLFDIDDTLITTGGAGRRAVVRALAATCGDRPWLGFSLCGRTDRSIVREALREHGIADEVPLIDRILETYLGFLTEEVRSGTGYAVNPGVPALLDRAASAPERYAVGLGTGNLRRGAAIKLGRVGLWESFGFGGFGCDSEDRAAILRIASLRGAAWLGLPLEECEVVVVGDTPRAGGAARAIGPRPSAGATGRFAVTALPASGAEAAFEDLARPGAVEAVLG
jgi:phosphoglycolate phosphatase-like HAD superfamily hydrolase